MIGVPGTTTYAIQLAEYFTARGAKVAFFSKNELTDGDLNILQETYKEETISKGTYFTYHNIDFYFFGRVPENWGIYNSREVQYRQSQYCNKSYKQPACKRIYIYKNPHQTC